MPTLDRGGRALGAGLAISLLLASTPGLAAEPGDRIAEVFASRVEMQKQLGSWLESSIREIAAPYQALVTVRLAMRGEVRDLVQREDAPGSELKIGSSKSVKLPGLPLVDKPLTGPAAPDISVKVPGRARVEVRRQVESQVERITAHLFVEKGMPSTQLDRVKQIVSDLAGLDPARGDVLDVSELAPRMTSGGGLSLSLLLVCATFLLAALFLAIAIGRRQAAAAAAGGDEAGEEAGAAAEGGAATVALDEIPAGEPVTEEDGRPRPFSFLRSAHRDEVVEVLADLDPAVAAAVLDKVGLEPQTIRSVFEQMPPDRQLAMAGALGRSRIVPRATVDQMEESVRAALERVRSRMKVGGEARLADILSMAPEAAQRELLDRLAERDPALAQAIRGKMLLFEDLAGLSSESVRQVVTGLDPGAVALALSGASLDVHETVMNSVSKRLRAILEAEVEAMPERPAVEVEAARRSVEQVMRRLQLRGILRARAA